MSVKAIAWAYEQRTGDPVKKAVLVAIADVADDAGYCWPSLALIATKAEIHPRTVQRHLRALEEAKLLQVDRTRARDDGSRTSNGYQLALHLRPLFEEAPPRQIATPDKLPRAAERRGPHGDCVTPNEPSVEPSLLMVHAGAKDFLNVLPPWVPVEAWQSFVAVRKAKRQPLTSSAVKVILKKLDGFRGRGHDAGDVLMHAVERGWTTVYEPKKDGRASTAADRARAADEFARSVGGEA